LFQTDIKQREREDLGGADRLVLFLLMAHLPFIYFLVPMDYGTHWLGAIPATLVVIASALAYRAMPGSLISRSMMTVSLMIMSMILIMQQLGRLEMHFHIFAAMAFIIIWRDYRMILLPRPLLLFTMPSRFRCNCQAYNWAVCHSWSTLRTATGKPFSFMLLLSLLRLVC